MFTPLSVFARVSRSYGPRLRGEEARYQYPIIAVLFDGGNLLSFTAQISVYRVFEKAQDRTKAVSSKTKERKKKTK